MTLLVECGFIFSSILVSELHLQYNSNASIQS